MTTQQELRGKWKQLAGKVKEKYGQITDHDLTRVEGNVDQLVGLVQQKTGQTREQIEAFFEECGGSCESMMEHLSDYASSAGETLRGGYDNVAEQTKRGYDASMKTLSRHPLESVGTAFGIGMVAGLLIGISLGSNSVLIFSRFALSYNELARRHCDGTWETKTAATGYILGRC